MKNISISIEEELIQVIEEILQRDKTKKSRSSLISESLREYILIHYPSLLSLETNNLGPSILSQLQSKKKYIKGPSFRFSRKLNIKLEPWKIIE